MPYQNNGFLRDCTNCGRKIYLKEDNDGIWRPYAAWIEDDDVQVGEWRLHDCGGRLADGSQEQADINSQIVQMMDFISSRDDDQIQNYGRSQYELDDVIKFIKKSSFNELRDILQAASNQLNIFSSADYDDEEQLDNDDDITF